SCADRIPGERSLSHSTGVTTNLDSPDHRRRSTLFARPGQHLRLRCAREEVMSRIRSGGKPPSQPESLQRNSQVGKGACPALIESYFIYSVRRAGKRGERNAAQV